VSSKKGIGLRRGEVIINPVKKVIPILVIVILVLLGLGFFLITRNPSSTAPDSTQNQNLQEDNLQTGTVGSKQSLRALLGLPTSQTCEYTDDRTGSGGKVYVSSGRFQGDFSNVVNGQVSTSHIYSDGQTMYIWMEGSDTGFKNSLAAVESITPSPDDNAGVETDFNIDEQLDYRCQNWTVDESLFQLPSGVQFKSMESVMQDAGLDCSTCDSLTGDPKIQCLAALGCN